MLSSQSIEAKDFVFEVITVSKERRLREDPKATWFKKCEYGFIKCMLETRDSNPYSLDPKSSALPVKLVSIESTDLKLSYATLGVMSSFSAVQKSVSIGRRGTS